MDRGKEAASGRLGTGGRVGIHSRSGECVRRKILALSVAALATACTRTPIAQAPSSSEISILPVPSQSTPSPLLEVRIGHVRGVIPSSWKAEMLPKSQLAREGFVASP